MRHILLFSLGAALLLPLSAADHASTEAKRSPKDVLYRLKQGNHVYVAGAQRVPQVSPARRASVVAGQHPHTVVLTCADSRVPPEYIFNEGIGSLFVIRVAGGVADPVTVGSVEYGIEHLHAPLVVVMGHTRCGAVKAALETARPAEAPEHGPVEPIESILALIRPGIPKGAGHGDAWTAAVYGGVEQTVEDLFHVSKVIPEMARKGEVGVIGAVYEIETGKVAFSEFLAPDKVEHPADPNHVVEWTAASTGRKPARVAVARAH